jgi:hypothetical protein
VLFERCGYGERMSARYLLDGFGLANRYAPAHAFDDEQLPRQPVRAERADGVAEPCTYGPSSDPSRLVAAIDAAMARFGATDNDAYARSLALTLWRCCGELEGLLPLLEELSWSRLDADAVQQLTYWLSSIADHDDEEDPPRWPQLSRRLPAVATLLAEVASDYREKAGRWLNELASLDLDEESRASAFDLAVELIPRVCAAPYAPEEGLGIVLAQLSVLAPAVMTEQRQIIDVFERACRRDSDRALIEAGLQSLHCELPKLLRRAFLSAPKPLLHTARRLGTLSGPRARSLLAEVRATPLFTAEPESMTAGALAALADDALRRPSSLVSKRLREHVAGGPSMRDGQLERARARIAERWDEVLLQAIEEETLAAASAGLGDVVDVGAPGVRHAVLMLPDAWRNKRALRRALRAHLAGDEGYLSRHPENQRWLREHPRLSAHLWSHGVVLRKRQQRDDPASEVVLRLEREPLEVLRLGSYVGSCFGLGGSMSHSAAAVLLDVNKQVIYCRDRRGRVLARQILAISETDQLVCFDVYPDVDEELRQLFWEYDWAFAEALGVELLDPEDPEQPSEEVRLLLAHDWWYDGAVSPL